MIILIILYNALWGLISYGIILTVNDIICQISNSEP